MFFTSFIYLLLCCNGHWPFVMSHFFFFFLLIIPLNLILCWASVYFVLCWTFLLLRSLLIPFSIVHHFKVSHYSTTLSLSFSLSFNSKSNHQWSPHRSPNEIIIMDYYYYYYAISHISFIDDLWISFQCDSFEWFVQRRWSIESSYYHFGVRVVIHVSSSSDCLHEIAYYRYGQK